MYKRQLGTRFELGRLAAIATAVITLIIGIKESNIEWGMSNIMTMVFMVLGGTILFIALFLLEAAFCFFTIEDGGILHMLTYGAREHGKYPLDVYGNGIKNICTYFVPYTLVQYYPLQYLLGKTDPVSYTHLGTWNCAARKDGGRIWKYCGCFTDAM